MTSILPGHDDGHGSVGPKPVNTLLKCLYLPVPPVTHIRGSDVVSIVVPGINTYWPDAAKSASTSAKVTRSTDARQDGETVDPRHGCDLSI